MKSDNKESIKQLNNSSFNTTYIEFEGKRIQKTSGLNCPVCSNNLEINHTLYEIPDFGSVNLIAYSCSKCTYKSSEIMPTENKDAYRYEFLCKDASDLYVKVVRGPDTSIEIKELAISLEPGGSASFFHTSIESILVRFRNAIDSMIRNHRLILLDYANIDDKQDEATKVGDEILRMQEMLEKIENYLSSKESFTIILESREGHGAIISNSAIKTKI